MQERPKSMGFWDYPIRGISTPSAKWMADLLTAQKSGGDLSPHVSSLNAAKIPNPAYPDDQFPGHSAWISGDWKLHRIANKQGKVTWELYNLTDDPKEKTNLAEQEVKRTQTMQAELEGWLKSVVHSLNGKDYGSN